MVDLKNINIPKVNVDTKKMFGAVDSLVDKIPPQIQSLLRKIAIGLFIFFLIMAIYTGWTKGWEGAKPQGLQLAQDTRSLFLMEVERDYNRKRKDVQMTDPEDLSYESNRKMQFDFISEREGTNPTQRTYPEESDFLGKEYDFRNRKAEDTSLPPLATPSGDGLIPSPVDVEKIGAWQNTDELQEMGRETPKQLDRGRPDLSAKPQRVSPTTGPSNTDLDTAEDLRFKKMLDRVDELEKKIAEKKKRETTTTPSLSPASESTGRKPRELERVPRQ
ncbi:LIC_11485 family protein [Leptospira ilyithenensis]|uniref:Uncharacterized protein n=1 Tax=Leptospira ilyithenensis TaxID=2484901 RepID=A0A4R9LP21_9LEPT|nr:hypothetical protein [Leptospira ilyithenensis]TGN10589.1 hypothetical protein EHS11_09900 [Leptospira ilyithenensis]